MSRCDARGEVPRECVSWCGTNVQSGRLRHSNLTTKVDHVDIPGLWIHRHLERYLVAVFFSKLQSYSDASDYHLLSQLVLAARS